MIDPTELTTEECVDLLRANVVGRVALATPVGPRIVLLNYAVQDDSVVFRTSSYSQLATYGFGADLAFEVDYLDYETHQGWSVVAVGRGLRVDDPDEIQRIRAEGGPRPWAAGSRGLHVRLRWRELTGRRLGSDWTRQSMTPVRRTV